MCLEFGYTEVKLSNLPDFAFPNGRIIGIIVSKYEILDEIGYLLCIRKDSISNKKFWFYLYVGDRHC